MKLLVQTTLTLVLIAAFAISYDKPFSVANAQSACKLTVPLTSTLIDARAATYRNIQPGDTICLQAGVRAGLTIQNFKGTAANPIIFRNEGGLVRIENGTKSDGILINNSRYVKLLGNGVAGTKYGIRIKGQYSVGVRAFNKSSDVEIAFIEVVNPGGDITHNAINVGSKSTCADGEDISFDYDGDGKEAYDLDDVVSKANFVQYNFSVHDNLADSMSRDGMYLGKNRTIVADSGQGKEVDCTNSPDDPLNPVIIGFKAYNNIIKNANWDALNLKGTPEGCEIYNNTIYDFSAENRDDQRGGIATTINTNCNIYNNTIYNGKAFGIADGGNGGGKIYNNLIYNIGTAFANTTEADGAGILIRNSADGITPARLVVANNTISNPGSYGILFARKGTVQNLITNNIIVMSDNLAGIVVRSQATAIQDKNQIYRGVASAKFTNPASADYTLAVGSSAIDAGRNLTSDGIINDITGKRRPTGIAYDVGAYEYGQGPATTITPSPTIVATATPIPSPTSPSGPGATGGFSLPINGSIVSNSITVQANFAVSSVLNPILGTYIYLDNNTTPIKSCFGSFECNFSFNTSSVSNGTHTLKAEADLTFGESVFNTINVTVRNEISNQGSVNNRYVSTSGNDSNNGSLNSPWKNIHTSLLKLKPGDVLNIMGGTYTFEGQTLKSQNSGTATAHIVVKNYNNEKVTIKNTAAWKFQDVSYWDLSGLNFENYDRGIRLGEHKALGDTETLLANNITIKNGSFKNASEEPFNYRNADNIEITNNTFENIRPRTPFKNDKGVEIGSEFSVMNVKYRGNNLVFKNNTFLDVSSDGIQLGAQSRLSGSDIRKVDIIGNTFRITRPYVYKNKDGSVPNCATSVYNFSTGNHTICKDFLGNIGENAIDIKTVKGPVLISGNTIQGYRPAHPYQDVSGADGVGVVMHNNFLNVTIEKNKFIDNTKHIAATAGAVGDPYVGGNLVIKNNTLTGSKDFSGYATQTGLGILIGEIKNVKIYNNTLYNNDSNAIVSRGAGLSGTATDVELKNNIIWGGAIVGSSNVNQFWDVKNNIINVSGSRPAWLSSSTNIITTSNPGINTTTFKLNVGSSAIDTGMNLLAENVVDDIENMQRPVNKFDIGAYEYNSSVVPTPVPTATIIVTPTITPIPTPTAPSGPGATGGFILPLNGATLAGNVTVQVNFAVTSVLNPILGTYIYLDNGTSPISSCFGSFECNLTLETITLTNGSHTLKAEADMLMGDSVYQTIIVNINNSTVPPVVTPTPIASPTASSLQVSIKYPTSGNKIFPNVDSTLMVDVTGTDAISKVEYYNNNTKLGESSIYPYSLNIKLASGNYNLTARAYDIKGRIATSTVVNFEVLSTTGGPTNTPPTPVIVSPSASVTINEGESVSFTGSATDLENNLPLSYNWNFGGGAANSTLLNTGPVMFSNKGTYTVSFSATDSLGATASAPVIFVFVNANTASSSITGGIITPSNNSLVTFNTTIVVDHTLTGLLNLPVYTSIYIGNTASAVATCAGSSTCTYDWDISNVTNGARQIISYIQTTTGSKTSTVLVTVQKPVVSPTPIPTATTVPTTGSTPVPTSTQPVVSGSWPAIPAANGDDSISFAPITNADLIGGTSSTRNVTKRVIVDGVQREFTGCTQTVHDRYFVIGADGRKYRTWHPMYVPVDLSKPNDKWCAFAHEHGDKPLSIAKNSPNIPMPAFGYVSVQRGVAVPSHVGFKVYGHLSGNKTTWNTSETNTSIQPDWDTQIVLHQGSPEMNSSATNQRLNEQYFELQYISIDNSLRITDIKVLADTGTKSFNCQTKTGRSIATSVNGCTTETWNYVANIGESFGIFIPALTINPMSVYDGANFVSSSNTICGTSSLNTCGTKLPFGDSNIPASGYMGTSRRLNGLEYTWNNAGGSEWVCTDSFGVVVSSASCGNSSAATPKGFIRQRVAKLNYLPLVCGSKSIWYRDNTNTSYWNKAYPSNFIPQGFPAGN